METTPLDDRALLYDRLLPCSIVAAADALDARGEFEDRAIELRHLIEARLRTGDGSYRSEEKSERHRESNPHMHLLEAHLAWAEIGAIRVGP